MMKRRVLPLVVLVTQRHVVNANKPIGRRCNHRSKRNSVVSRVDQKDDRRITSRGIKSLTFRIRQSLCSFSTQTKIIFYPACESFLSHSFDTTRGNPSLLPYHRLWCMRPSNHRGEMGPVRISMSRSRAPCTGES
eukprot:Lithocolla_globosa_v1_NODE_4793_length_1364_cov_13.662338.p2 type:complete len:135 gc:universal NODE_4793_length_1364_cov_13.662338:831-1235(+)